ncbi:uncharacterized protein LOC107765529 [Nicotiana tabacum]|uniref:Uncharacterized protein LOC107765529 n=2 Tax=Nicotiana TaxID=4085 RepID=A0A1S3XI82_TOBAC|nr:PREDICTED: uncharacterized protein LOC104213390 [Nicotiana sylvestris]XP_016439675.1 PREDICTED: uncharacterized protein LOC107765529 [Nicotiana tabacum]
MSDPYEKVKGGRLTFKGGTVASRSKAIDKKKKKKKNKSTDDVVSDEPLTGDAAVAATEQDADAATDDIYTIDAAKRRKYDELFPVEAKKFGYDPNAKVKSVEDALDDRVKKKADRYCK